MSDKEPIRSGRESSLTPYRVLDLTEGGLNLAGKLLADLGADVLRIEPPSGSSTRCQGPFYRDEIHPEKSLFWFAFNLNKRGITLNIATRYGRELLLELARRCDIIIESLGPGRLEELGLGYEALSQINPGLILSSVTPFGPDGPYAHFQATDLVIWAISGVQAVTGDPDRAPVRISVPMAEAIAGSFATAGIMHALWYRSRTGLGQRVDVSEQIAAVWTNMAQSAHGFEGVARHREGEDHTVTVDSGSFRMRDLYRCKDGYVSYFSMQGHWGAQFHRRLASWMLEEGAAPDYFKDFDWEHWTPTLTLGRRSAQEAQEEVDRVEEPFARFFLTKTKEELFHRAVRDEIMLAPVLTNADLFHWEQLKAREFWVEVAHPEIDATIHYPGPFARFSETPVMYRRRAPLIGEHNREVYVDELGHGVQELVLWRSAGVI